jgi:hypothetical protein
MSDVPDGTLTEYAPFASVLVEAMTVDALFKISITAPRIGLALLAA